MQHFFWNFLTFGTVEQRPAKVELSGRNTTLLLDPTPLAPPPTSHVHKVWTETQKSDSIDSEFCVSYHERTNQT